MIVHLNVIQWPAYSLIDVNYYYLILLSILWLVKAKAPINDTNLVHADGGILFFYSYFWWLISVWFQSRRPWALSRSKGNATGTNDKGIEIRLKYLVIKLIVVAIWYASFDIYIGIVYTN